MASAEVETMPPGRYADGCDLFGLDIFNYIGIGSNSGPIVVQ